MGLSAGFSSEGGRLPRRLEDLRGPWQGVVVLPIHLTWGGAREFDVGSERPRLQLYSTVLSQGRPGDMVRLLNARRLAEDWPQLRVLVSRKVRRTCERKLGLRAPAARSHSARGRGAGD
ncbi:MAG: hypothetical protein ACRDOU_10195 [Streptosporangiaceae bacterium]